MCGIAGLVAKDGSPPANAVLDSFARALAHRGPDGEGRYRFAATAMVQTRLAIIDLETGDQPLGGGGGPALIANGEIYNYLELTAAVDATALLTRSDCELPLHLYRRDGVGFAADLRGMYAIAIHDPAADRLLLARDPFGIKPLYYVETPDCFAFASEPQALIAAGLASRRLSPAVRGELLQLQFTTGRETIFADIKRVLPGETLTVSGARVVDRRRLAALPEGAPRSDSVESSIARLDGALEDSIRIHQRSDVPYGMFLSGGIDSTTLLAVMARLNDRPVRAYTAGFAASGVPDERSHARLMAQRLGAEHVELMIEEADFWRALPEIAEAVDDPCADYAVVPSYLLAELAAREVKVILCGEGGDELFGGYGRYRSALRPWWRGGRRMRRRGTFERLGVLREESPGWRDGVVGSESTATGAGRSRLQIAQATDCADWLANDLLIKLDRCLMAHGVEGRTPFLDPAVADAAFLLADGLKIRDGRGKWLLRRWLADRVPDSGAFQPKRGFTVPAAEWIRGQGARLGPLVAAQPGIDEICRPGAVAELFTARDKRSGFAAWVLLFYALWHRRHMLGLTPDGDTFETLAASPRP
ncbi:MAG: asparagine synthase (glutamine-hydrolyzing) [Alphaproteobacteria bacterium]|jgi:asparagine synthase (glutamine-hydrolysing)|nr:asparagine synthase (glutamine-hydrolyzing) [Alphaproteobacteria bacterium]MDP6517214.1 asparagine synthase (glutamine-hydrolyzing) [Alphaproteobacteria bacterium]